VALAGIGLAWKFYVVSPDISEGLARQFAGAHRVLSHKYLVDEFYGANVIKAVFSGARGLWFVDRNVVDGAVNGSGRVTIVSSWFSGLAGKNIGHGGGNLGGRPRALSRACATWSVARFGKAATSFDACRPASCRTTRC